MPFRPSIHAWLAASVLASCHWSLGGCSAANEEPSSFRSQIGGNSQRDGGSGAGGNGGGGGSHVLASGGSQASAGSSTPSTLAVGSGTKPTSTVCESLSCHPTGGDYCGLVGNGCASLMDCGNCPKADWVCQDGLCKGGASCVARTSCKEGTATYCGKIGNDCGGELDCGDCSAPESCGGTGVANVCGDPNCQPLSCSLPVGKYCGVIGDGCGRSQDCGGCPDGAACGADGTPGVCPGSSGGVACSGIQCNVARCASGSTSVSGVVYDPAGVNPLYNVVVYIPNAPLEAIPTGATCEQCNAMLSGQPLTTALTDAKGAFRLENVPTGTNIPLVMQVGRWRRKVTIPKVEGCQETVLKDPQLTRLPRNKSEGDIPHIAITTGGADALECLIPRIGIDRSEVTTDRGSGRIHLYAGGNPPDAAATGTGTATGLGGLLAGLTGGGGVSGALNAGRGATTLAPAETLPHASTLWGDAKKMRGYDIVMFSCEGGEALPPKDSYLSNFEDYVDNGGRAFLTHYHYYWLSHGSKAFQGTANYTGDDLSTLGAPGTTATINTSFPKGAALADWLVNVAATPTRGQLTVYESRKSVSTVNPPTQTWIDLPGSPNRTQYLTFNTPVGSPTEQQCGRVVFTDLHIGAAVAGPPAQGGDTSTPAVAYPGGCSSKPMSPQIKALEFIFFDLAACVTPDFDTPTPPAPPPATVAAPGAAPVPPPPPPAVPH